MLAYDIVRITVLALFVLSAAVAVGSWAVRTQHISPFGRTGKTLRKLTDPILAPIETWLLRRGGNPQKAGWWLLGISIIGGVLVITTAQWIIIQLLRGASAAEAGPRGIARLVVYYATQLILFALLARVIGSWIGVGRYNKWMRPAFMLTDWMVEPLRRIIPPLGIIDVTPLVAWFLLLLLRGWLIRLI
jgi:YggT family protein